MYGDRFGIFSLFLWLHFTREAFQVLLVVFYELSMSLSSQSNPFFNNWAITLNVAYFLFKFTYFSKSIWKLTKCFMMQHFSRNYSKRFYCKLHNDFRFEIWNIRNILEIFYIQCCCLSSKKWFHYKVSLVILNQFLFQLNYTILLSMIYIYRSNLLHNKVPNSIVYQFSSKALLDRIYLNIKWELMHGSTSKYISCSCKNLL